MVNCDFSSACEGAVRDLASSFSSLRELSLNGSRLAPTQFTNDLLLDLARRPELRRAYFDVRLPFDYTENPGDANAAPMDAGILALLFRDVTSGVHVSFRSRHLHALISDEFSKRLLEVCIFMRYKLAD